MKKLILISDSPDFIKKFSIAVKNDERISFRFLLKSMASKNIVNETDSVIFYHGDCGEAFENIPGFNLLCVSEGDEGGSFRIYSKEGTIKLAAEAFSVFVSMLLSMEGQSGSLNENFGMVFYSSDLSQDWPWLLKGGSFLSLAGFPDEKFRENPFFWKTVINPNDLKNLEKRRVSLSVSGFFEFYFRVKDRDGIYRWLLSREILSKDEKSTSGILINIDLLKSVADKDVGKKKLEYLVSYLNSLNHELKNIFSSMLGYSHILENSPQIKKEPNKDLQELISLIKKSSSLIERYTLFVKKENFKKERVNIAHLLDSMQSVIRSLIRADIRGTLIIDDKNTVCEIDSVSVQQAILGLVVYLTENIPYGSELKIKLSKTRKNILKSVETLEYEEKDFAVIGLFVEVRDKSVLESKRIYDFYSQMQESELYSPFSLSNIEKSLENFGGSIKVCSKDDSVLYFEIFLPLVFDTAFKDFSAQFSGEERRSKIKKIILAEDDDGLRKFVARILKENGYNVFVCESIADILKVMEKEKSDIDLILTDIELPDGDSIDFAEKIRAENPGVRIIFNSGYNNAKSKFSKIESMGYRFIQKPYTIRDLISTIESEINSGN